jgi:hypothetical protein
VRRRTPIVGSGLALCLLALLATGCVAGGASAGSHKPERTHVDPLRGHIPKYALKLTVGAPVHVHPIRSGFLGLSIEYPSIEPYAGTDPSAINPLLVQLIRNLTPDQRPVIRIGGDSTDETWWPAPHIHKPGGVRYTLTPRWLAVTKALTQQLNARLILGIDLEANNLTLERAEASALTGGLGPGAIDALEPGNEPELYGSWTWYVSRDGNHVHGRPPSWSIGAYDQEFTHLKRSLHGTPLAGPATGSAKWIADLPQFLGDAPYLKLVTVHKYPLQLCYIPASDPRYPTIAHLLSAQASRGLAASVARYVALAHARGKPVRIGEMNTNSCGSAPRVTESFASALWAVDALFAMASAGVDGVNIHTYDRSSYQLFAFSHRDGQWRARVYPEYSGLELFAQAAPPGSRLLHTYGPATRTLRAWATRAPDGRLRVTLINDDLSHPRTIAIRATDATSTATLTTLRAHSIASRGRVTMTSRSLAPTNGYYVVKVAPASAALLTR